MKRLPDVTKISHSSFLDESGCVVYKIITKPIRNAYLHYDANDNIFYVTCSKYFSKKQIDDFVKANYRKLISKYKQKEQLQDYQLFGKPLTINIIQSNTNKIELVNNVLTCNVKNKNQVKTLIRSYMLNIATSYLTSRCNELLIKVNKVVNKITVKWFGNRWGCYSRPKNELSLSAQLIKFDKDVIDSVIWHEIAHITCYDHSPKFHQLLKQYNPNNKELSKKLNHYFDF